MPLKAGLPAIPSEALSLPAKISSAQDLPVPDLLYITRKHPPSVGGMQRLSYDLRIALAKNARLTSITWGHSQAWLFLFLPYALLKAFAVLRLRPSIDALLIGDPVLAPLGLVLKRIFRKPCVAVIHGLDLTYPNRIYQKLFIGCLRKLDAFVAISEGTRRLAIERGLDSSRCVTIPVGVCLDRFPSFSAVGIEALKQWSEIEKWKAEGRLLLLTVGRLVPRKGVAWFIAEVLPALVKAHPEIRYLVSGSGPERARVQNLIRKHKLNDHVRLYGTVSEQFLHALYRVADIFVMPNIAVAGDYEGFGIVALEAAANGLCVVAARTEGIEDAVIDGENGILVPAGDGGAFVAMLNSLVEDQRTRKSVAERGREYINSHYCWDIISRDYLQLIASIRLAAEQ